MIHKRIDITLTGRNEDKPAGLYTYILENSPSVDPDRRRPAVIICPGGGYAYTSDREAEPIALKMLSAGFHAFVLRYNTVPYEYPVALLELASAVKIIRENSERWNIDPERIVVAGFSAGGHLACSYAAFWTKEFIASELSVSKEMLKPNGCLLGYPVITSGEFAHKDSFVNLLGAQHETLLHEMSLEHQITDCVPPVFLWHTFADGAVPVENSLLLVRALREREIPTEFHMYPLGGHGLALATEETMLLDGRSFQPECAGWIDLAVNWMKRL